MLLKIKTKTLTDHYNSKMQWHRDNDKPAVIYPDGSKLWYQNGEYLRSENATQD